MAYFRDIFPSLRRLLANTSTKVRTLAGRSEMSSTLAAVDCGAWGTALMIECSLRPEPFAWSDQKLLPCMAKTAPMKIKNCDGVQQRQRPSATDIVNVFNKKLHTYTTRH